MKQNYRPLIIIFLLLAAAAFAVWKWIPANQPATVTPASIAATPQALPADAYIVADTTLMETITAVGSIRANEEVEIVSEVSRRVTGIFFTEGQHVRKGQLLFKLDDADLLAQQQRLSHQEALARKEVERATALLQREGISQQEYDRLYSQLQIIEADLLIVKENIAKTEIKAPFDGKTGIRKVSEGALVSPNTPMLSLKDMGRVKIDFFIPEKYASRVGTGQPLTFTVENSADTYKAVLTLIEPGIDPSTRNLTVRAEAANEKGTLFAGSSATVQLPLQEISHTLLVPAQSIIPELQGQVVLVVRNGAVKKQPVTTGVRNNRNIQITNGLQIGDTVLTSNLLRAREGMKVRIDKLVVL